ncbi:MAG: (Fe-S)-binding protein [Desulfovibrio sp.]|nr:MAG: (Fe-S)-binding protein [Desulfovibrio sp.]
MTVDTQEKKIIEDPGIDQGAAKLTPEKIAQVINTTLGTENLARLYAYTKTCVHCGLCSDACHYFLSHDRDPKYSPVGKIKNTLWPMIKNKGKVSVEFMKEAARIAHTECNLCRRCVQYCPFGIDTAFMISTVRRIVHKLALTPQYIQDTAHSHAATMNQMWVKEDEWIDALMWQEDEARDEFPDFRIPLDKEGSDVYYSVIGPEPKFRTQLIYQAAAIFHEAGVDFTMPSGTGWDNSDMCMFTGDFEMMGRLKRDHYESAMKLKVNKIVMGECGHAYRSVYDMGNRWLGWREMPVPIIHSIQYFYELLMAGKIKVASTIDKLATFHDPCNTVRGMGLHEMGRAVAKAFVPNMVEMYPNREHNYCCAAGGGVINCGPPHKMTRVHGNKIKAEQLKATGAELIVAPCHNCHGGLEDIVHHYKLDMEIKFLGDIIYEHMVKTKAVEE